MGDGITFESRRTLRHSALLLDWPCGLCCDPTGRTEGRGSTELRPADRPGMRRLP